MKIAIAHAYNGLHRTYRKYLNKMGFDTCYFEIDDANWLKHVRDTKADAFIWNADDKGANYHLILDRVYFIEKYLQKPMFPDHDMYFIFNDKIKQKNILDNLGISVLPTFITYQKQKALEYIKKAKYPFVLKDAHGFEGKAVFKIDSEKDAKDIIEKIFSDKGYSTIKNHFYAQKFVHNLGRDLRIIVIGNKVAAAYWRISQPGNWKTNLGQGGDYSFENIPEEPKRICLEISKKMKYHWMAYDCLVVKGKTYIGEFSPNFGVKGPRLHGIDIRRMQMEYIAKKFRNKK